MFDPFCSRALILALAIGLTACVHQAPAAQAQTARASANGDAAAGRHIAEIYCARCHAIGAEGESTHPMSPPFRTLSRAYPINALQEAFAEGILVGHPDMPEFQLEPAQIDDLLAYIQSIQPRQGS